MTVEDIIAERGRTHGLFSDNGQIAQDTRELWRRAPNWHALQAEQQLVLDEIALKVARLLSTGSDPNFVEHWDDIAGYAVKGSQACKKT